MGLRPAQRRHLLVYGRFGWVTGHSYITYGPLAAGATVLMYEGALNWPDEGRTWEIIEKYRVTIFYTAPTAIRPASSGATIGSTIATCRACACWAPSAKGSIPRRGCGITARSAANVARSSIPGGKPKPAAS